MGSASLKCDEKVHQRGTASDICEVCVVKDILFDYKIIHKSLVHCTGDMCRATYYGNWDSASISISIYL